MDHSTSETCMIAINGIYFITIFFLAVRTMSHHGDMHRSEFSCALTCVGCVPNVRAVVVVI